MNKKDLINLQNTVEGVLKKNIEARSDDFILLSEVLSITNPETIDMTVRNSA